MVTLLDIGILQSFDFVFPVLLVWAFVFAILQKTEVIGKSVGINAIIASCAALMILLSQTVIDIVNFMIPWFTVAIIFFLLMLLLFMIFGANWEKAIQDKALQWVLIAVGLLILVAAGGKVLGQSLLEVDSSSSNQTVINGEEGVATSSFETNIINTLRHPKILGLIIVFAIIVFAIALLSGMPDV